MTSGHGHDTLFDGIVWDMLFDLRLLMSRPVDSSSGWATSSTRRASYDEYLSATALTFARRHRPVWSWRHWRRICRCGADLPCRARRRELRAEYADAPVSLALHLGAYLVQGTENMPWGKYSSEVQQPCQPSPTGTSATRPNDLASSLIRPACRKFTPKRSLVRSQYRPP
ncbi:hypothetical protein ACQPYA_20885 [Micromonospora sp. CA-263727]|uniref:hypothetical protein n=1 Tax=Micromonospora sp. CA-263727 TaxID=3239967 RepID=UPI003D91CE39